jgi:hypothetical protein
MGMHGLVLLADFGLTTLAVMSSTFRFFLLYCNPAAKN